MPTNVVKDYHKIHKIIIIIFKQKNVSTTVRIGSSKMDIFSQYTVRRQV